MVADFIAQAAARCERIRAVRKINKEAVARGQLTGHCLGKRLITAAPCLGQHCNGYHWKSQDGLAPLLIEPIEEKALQAIYARKIRTREIIRENEVGKNSGEIMAVINGNIPEHALIATRCRWLVERIDHTLQMVGDFCTVRIEIVIAVVTRGEMVKIGQELDGRHRPGKLRTDGKDKIDECAAKRSEVLRRTRFAA